MIAFVVITIMLSLIRGKQERGEKVPLPLTFEGKYVGTAEVLRNE